MDKFWYNHEPNSKEFKVGLKQADIFKLRSLLGVFGKKQREGKQVKIQITAIRRELERR